MPLSIEDDDSVIVMFDLTDQKQRTFVELYVEIEELAVQNQGYESFTQLLSSNQPTFSDAPNELNFPQYINASRNMEEIGTSSRSRRVSTSKPTRNIFCENLESTPSTPLEAVIRLAGNDNLERNENHTYDFIWGEEDVDDEEDPDYEIDDELEEEYDDGDDGVSEEEEQQQTPANTTSWHMPSHRDVRENDRYSGFEWPYGHVSDDIPLHQPMSSYITQPGSFEMNNQWHNQEYVKYPGNWDPEVDEPFIGLHFSDKEMMHKGMKIWSVKRNRHFVSYKSKKDYWEVRCRYFNDAQVSCKWRIRGSLRKSHGLFEVSKYHGPHTCVHSSLTTDHPQIDSKLVALTIQKVVEDEPTVKINSLKNLVQVRFEKVISYKKLWLGKQKAIANIFESWESSYKALPKFMQAIQKYNPGTVAHYMTTPSYDRDGNPIGEVLDNFFFIFPPVVAAFQHCRPVVGIDATHLYGKYKGKLLLAMTFDADNHVFPIACAFVEEESTEVWSYFLRNLMFHVIKYREDICLVSDRHAGILNAVSDVWEGPGFVHRFCALHFLENFKKAFKGEPDLHKLAKDAIWELQEKKLIKTMAAIEAMNPEAHIWLLNEPVEKWSNFYDKGKRHGAMTTNMVEIFNNVLLGARCLPITAAVQLPFYKLVQLFCDRRNIVAGMRSNGIRYGRNIKEKIEERMSNSGHEIIAFDMISGNYSVKTSRRHSRGGNTYVVNIYTSECDCGKWPSDKIPCSHVHAICASQHYDWETFLSPYYKIDKYEATYAPQFFPLRDEAYWDECHKILLPDVSRLRSKGRPKSTRFRNGMDVSQRRARIRCSMCQLQGHDARTCPNPTARRRRH